MFQSAISVLNDRGLGVLVSAGLNLVRASLHKKVLGKTHLEKVIHDYRMLLDLNDRGISRGLILFGTREVDHKILLEKILMPGMRVFDIGANIGYYALMELGLIGKEGEIICIEPSPANVALLQRNLALNGYLGIPVIEGAISDQQGTRDFYMATQSNLGTFHNTGTGAVHLSGEVINVAMQTVPDLAKQFGAPDLIRMDVEGHEVEVFNGMTPAIEAGEIAPIIIFETHLTRYGEDHDMEAALKRLFKAGYHVRHAASSSEHGTSVVKSYGYDGGQSVVTDGVTRVLFENIADDHAVEMICHKGGLRTVVLQKKG